MFGGLDYLNNWTKQKAAIYIRVSTLNQAEKGHGLEGQLGVCKKMCDIKNYDIADVYADEGISGTMKAHDRKGFNKLLIDAREKKFQILVFYTFDRLARDIRIFLSIVDELNELGIKIVSCKENIDTTTDTGEFMMNIYASVSHLELKTIKARLAMGREQKKLESGYIGGNLPYGYSRVDGRIEINPSHANVVRAIYQAYHGKKFSLRKIARILDTEGIKTPKGGKKWHQSSVISILDNRDKYRGSLINDNLNNIHWPIIITHPYPMRIKQSENKKGE